MRLKLECAPNIAITGTLYAILEEICSQLRALLLVVLGIVAVLIRVALGCLLEFGEELLRGLTGHRGIEIASIGCLRSSSSSWSL